MLYYASACTQHYLYFGSYCRTTGAFYNAPSYVDFIKYSFSACYTVACTEHVFILAHVVAQQILLKLHAVGLPDTQPKSEIALSCLLAKLAAPQSDILERTLIHGLQSTFLLAKAPSTINNPVLPRAFFVYVFMLVIYG